MSEINVIFTEWGKILDENNGKPVRLDDVANRTHLGAITVKKQLKQTLCASVDGGMISILPEAKRTLKCPSCIHEGCILHKSNGNNNAGIIITEDTSLIRQNGAGSNSINHPPASLMDDHLVDTDTGEVISLKGFDLPEVDEETEAWVVQDFGLEKHKKNANKNQNTFTISDDDDAMDFVLGEFAKQDTSTWSGDDWKNWEEALNRKLEKKGDGTRKRIRDQVDKPIYLGDLLEQDDPRVQFAKRQMKKGIDFSDFEEEISDEESSTIAEDAGDNIYSDNAPDQKPPLDQSKKKKKEYESLNVNDISQKIKQHDPAFTPIVDIDGKTRILRKYELEVLTLTLQNSKLSTHDKCKVLSRLLDFENLENLQSSIKTTAYDAALHMILVNNASRRIQEMLRDINLITDKKQFLEKWGFSVTLAYTIKDSIEKYIEPAYRSKVKAAIDLSDPSNYSEDNLPLSYIDKNYPLHARQISMHKSAQGKSTQSLTTAQIFLEDLQLTTANPTYDNNIDVQLNCEGSRKTDSNPFDPILGKKRPNQIQGYIYLLRDYLEETDPLNKKILLENIGSLSLTYWNIMKDIPHMEPGICNGCEATSCALLNTYQLLRARFVRVSQFLSCIDTFNRFIENLEIPTESIKADTQIISTGIPERVVFPVIPVEKNIGQRESNIKTRPDLMVSSEVYVTEEIARALNWPVLSELTCRGYVEITDENLLLIIGNYNQSFSFFKSLYIETDEGIEIYRKEVENIKTATKRLEIGNETLKAELLREIDLYTSITILKYADRECIQNFIPINKDTHNTTVLNKVLQLYQSHELFRWHDLAKLLGFKCSGEELEATLKEIYGKDNIRKTTHNIPEYSVSDYLRMYQFYQSTPGVVQKDVPGLLNLVTVTFSLFELDFGLPAKEYSGVKFTDEQIKRFHNFYRMNSLSQEAIGKLFESYGLSGQHLSRRFREIGLSSKSRQEVGSISKSGETLSFEIALYASQLLSNPNERYSIKKIIDILASQGINTLPTQLNGTLKRLGLPKRNTRDQLYIEEDDSVVFFDPNDKLSSVKAVRNGAKYAIISQSNFVEISKSTYDFLVIVAKYNPTLKGLDFGATNASNVYTALVPNLIEETNQQLLIDLISAEINSALTQLNPVTTTKTNRKTTSTVMVEEKIQKQSAVFTTRDGLEIRVDRDKNGAYFENGDIRYRVTDLAFNYMIAFLKNYERLLGQKLTMQQVQTHVDILNEIIPDAHMDERERIKYLSKLFNICQSNLNDIRTMKGMKIL